MADGPSPSARKSVTVLFGGWSPEREVSLVSGEAAAEACERLGYAVRLVDVSRDLASLQAALSPPPDVVFNALHGIGGEDGCVQSLLEILGIPVTHSGRLASAVAMDKPMTKALVAPLGVPVAAEWRGLLSVARAEPPLPLPFVVKPPNSGSSCGVTIVHTTRDLAAINAEDQEVMLERFVPGRELTVAVFSDPGQRAEAFGITELRTTEGFYDYHAKYTDGVTQHLVPAPVPDAVADRAKAIACQVHDALGCRGLTRSDFRWDDTLPGSDGLVFLEINTQPGLTPLSLAPEQAAAAGVSFDALVARMVEAAR